MENKSTNIIKTRFLGNGKFLHDNNIYSTKFKSAKESHNKLSNGKNFVNEFNQVDLNKYSKKNGNNRGKISSWILDTLNPLNHLPIISTISKIASNTNKSLDIAQSAIGGAIYGGGPIGLAKGLGSWFVNKLIPKELLANNLVSKKLKKQAATKTKEIIKPNDKPVDNLSSSSNETSFPTNILNTSKQLEAISEDIRKKNQPKYNNFFYYYSNERKIKDKKIDVDA